MPAQNLILNILTFDPPVKEKAFAFYMENGEGKYPISKWEFPINIHQLFTEEQLQDVEYLYTDFKQEGNASLKVNLAKCTRFAKHYYTFLINGYFRNKANITCSNFINDNELWFINSEETTEATAAYRVFTIKVQINRVSKKPELVLSYDGISLIEKRSIQDLDIDTTLYKWVVYKKQLYRYEAMPDEANYHLDKVFPVLNNKLKYALGYPVEPKLVRNKYENYYNKLMQFYSAYIDQADFRKVIPVSSSFVSVDKLQIKNTTPGSNLLLFGQGNTGISPYDGIKNHGPCEITSLKHIRFIFIYHAADREIAKEIIDWFQGNKKGFKGLKSFLRMNCFIDGGNSICFRDLENPIEEIRQQLSTKAFDPNTRYIAIYISPFTKYEPEEAKRNVYYQLKEELLKYRITSQVIDRAKVQNPKFNFSLPNIAIAILAKLEGVPWRLHRALYKELIVGVGAFKSATDNTRYVGSAFCFSNDGHFQGFDCYDADDTFMLAGSIREAVQVYMDKHKDVKRLVVHFYKTMSRNELEPIKNELYKLKLKIPVIVITINKTESKDLVIFDLNCPELIPVSGTFISIGRNQFLLCNNTRYGNSNTEKIEGFPFPIKLSMSATEPQLLEDPQLIKDLIDQVYQFSRMYWKSVKQQNLPVTIKYPEMVAEIYPHFEDKTLKRFGRENLWFL